MALIKHILSPVDFSDTSTAAARQAEELARKLGAQLTLLHVLNEPAFSLAEGSGYAPPSIIEEYETAMKKRLALLTDELSKQGVSVEGKLVRGTPHEVIVSEAEQGGASLIVIGTHGRTGLSHLLLGSVAERVVRTAKIPVMTVRTP